MSLTSQLRRKQETLLLMSNNNMQCNSLLSLVNESPSDLHTGLRYWYDQATS